ncbi:DivIVA domain-containing protein [Micromonospora sp. WMMC241]|uniref:DivIVA domain-containing protein n=1 Tax=Micromonospora sp. WMMC241 TaxID=3015159 RepID=UPI0022B6530E|nr:DivIVA domain-containing protein [Micromonospora sp. WMMC241]MCZ7437714.1 DivIVA domain-containing protein [Micromonospora sp. WMMC241]
MIVGIRRTTLGSAAAYPRLLPWQVRERRFKPAGFGRRGLDPREVYAYLERVSGELAIVYDALAASRREAAVAHYALLRREADQPLGDDR